MKRTLLVLWPLCLVSGVYALADVVTLKDGSQIKGSVESAGSRQLLIKVGDEARVVSMDQVASIEFNPVAAPVVSAAPIPIPEPPRERPPTPVPAPTPAPPPAPSATPVPPPARSATSGPPPAVAPAAQAADSGGITLPAGTEIAARTVDRIDSKKADKSTEYAASLDDPIVINGVTIAPVNATAVLKVTEIKNPKLAGRALLATTLVAVVIDGHRVKVETESVDSQSGSQSKRTAIGAGAGAAGGAAVGAAAAGGVGAAVGAGIGAAAGTVGAALTAKGVQIPPETRFTYKLSQPVTVNAPEQKK